MEKKSILVVEDDSIYLQLIVDTLKNKYDVKVAQNGEKGLEAFDKIKPQLIIVDVNMPIMTGVEMVQKIREKDKNVKIIMLTSNTEQNVLLKATELILTKYLLKPINLVELKESVDLAFRQLSNYQVVYKKLLHLDDGYVWSFEDNSFSKESKDIRLTPKERKILNFLFSNPNTTQSYENIMHEVWEYEEESSKKALKTLVNGLRKKLPNDLIKNVYGVGYKIDISD